MKRGKWGPHRSLGVIVGENRERKESELGRRIACNPKTVGEKLKRRKEGSSEFWSE